MAAPPPPNITNQWASMKSEMFMTISVGVGSSAPKFLNRSLNTGITKIMMTAVTTIATTTIEIG